MGLLGEQQLEKCIKIYSTEGMLFYIAASPNFHFNRHISEDNF